MIGETSNAVANATQFELQESSTADFAAPSTQVLTDQQASFTHTATAPAKYFYRVRGIGSCNDDKGRFSAVDAVSVLPPATANRHASVQVGFQNGISQSVVLPGVNPPVTFTARTNKPWATVTPSTGLLGPAGVTLTLTTDPAMLNLGANTATILLSYSSAGKDAQFTCMTRPSGQACRN